VHGTGGATSSWHHCLEVLARDYAVTVIDLPGHGFTTVPDDVDKRDDVYSLAGMARAVGALLRHIEVAPSLVAGHSAGVAVLVRMTLDGLIAPSRIVGFNPALVAPPAWYVSLVAPMLATLFESRALADGGAWLARSTGIIGQMLTSTGTTLSPADLARYEYLCRMPSHVHAALAMMSRWDLPRIVRDAVGLSVPLELYAGANDRWVPFAALSKSVSRIPAASLNSIAGAGHLLLEERPDVVVGALT